MEFSTEQGRNPATDANHIHWNLMGKIAVEARADTANAMYSQALPIGDAQTYHGPGP